MKKIKYIIAIIISLSSMMIKAQTNTCGDTKTTSKMEKSNLGIVIYSNDAETVWNAFRLANFALSQKDTVKIFLLGKGVEAQDIVSDKFDVKKQMESFVGAGGEILACGTCLKIRNKEGSALCPLSTIADLYQIIKQADKIITF